MVQPPVDKYCATPPSLAARVYDSGFELGYQQYNGLSAASDGRVYYFLCTGVAETGGQMFRLATAGGAVEHIGDLTEAAGEASLGAVPQGKVHTSLFEATEKLYFATHIGYYDTSSGREMIGDPPPGYRPYPGGHFLSYDLESGVFEDYATAPGGQGVLDFAIDAARGRMYGLTWPYGEFLRFDRPSGQLRNLGRVARDGEAGVGETYRALCRSLVVNPEDGSVYFTNADGDILRYDYARDTIERVAGEDLRKDYFGACDPSSPGHLGYNWRQAFWYPPEQAIYATHGNSGYLFRFDPALPRVDVLDRITSVPSRRSGMFDMFYYGYLGFALAPDGRTIHYLTGGPIVADRRRLITRRDTSIIGEQGVEDLHLVTYHIPTGAYRDHGAIYYGDGQRPGWVNSIAIGADGTVYFIGRITRRGRAYMELLSVKPTPCPT